MNVDHAIVPSIDKGGGHQPHETRERDKLRSCRLERPL
jgi:hypothetical protein